MLSVKVCAKVKNDKLKVDFGYFDICPDHYIEVTDKLTAIDKDDLTRLIQKDDPFILTNILMEPSVFMKVQEELGIKLARLVRGVESGNVGDDY